ncbi:DUF6507 family protein [Arthrobacter monumenti]
MRYRGISLAASTVRESFTGFATSVVMADVKAAMFGAANAIGATREATTAYASGDAQMATAASRQPPTAVPRRQRWRPLQPLCGGSEYGGRCLRHGQPSRWFRD